jgi:ABC-type branched-subunit amino acid transport system ATPase component
MTAILEVRELCKNFGGLAAVDHASLDVRPDELHAVIGPNGAGKTTLVNLLSGDLTASSGSILFHSSEISTLTPERRSAAAIKRPTSFPDLAHWRTAASPHKLASRERCIGSAMPSPMMTS